MEQGNATAALFSSPDSDGVIKAGIADAPPYMQFIYQIVKTSHDSNAAALAELKSSHAANAATLAENTRVLADNANALNNLRSRVNEVELRQQALSTQHDDEMAQVRTDIARISASNQNSLNWRSLKDPREIIVRGIPLNVQQEPSQLAAALLTALDLQELVPLVTKWHVWNQSGRTARPDLAAAAVVPAAPAPAAQSRAFVFTLACAETCDDILKKTPALRNLDCQNISGAGGKAKLSVNALWSNSVHKLLKYPSARYKQLGHLRPLVKNLTVFMRPTRNGPLHPVTCEADINALVPPPL